MADVTINPLAQISAVQSSSGQQNTSSQTSALHPGATLSGVIAGRDTAGNFLLRTDSGTFTLHSSAPLTYNSDVVIQVASGGTSARVLSVNGESFANYTAAEPETEDSVSASLLANLSQETQATSDTTSLPSSPSITVEATVLSSTPQTGTALTPAATPLPAAGSNVTLQITLPTANNSVPVNTSTASPAPQATNTVNTITPAAPPPTPAVASATVSAPEVTTNAATTAPLATTALSAPAPTSAPVATTNTAVTTLSDAPAPSAVITPEAVQAAPSAANATPEDTSANTAQLSQYAAYSKQSSSPVVLENSTTPTTQSASTPVSVAIPAQVVSSPAANTVVLNTPLGTITVQTNGALPLGALPSESTVTLTIPASATLAAAASDAPVSLPALAAGWQTLETIITMAGTSASDATATSIASRIPQLGQNNFAAASISMIASIAGGDIQAVLGDDTIAQLRQNGRADLLQRAGQELGLLQASTATPQEHTNAPSWQAIFLPFMFQEEIQQARLYIKRDSGKDKERSDKKSSDTRFVIEVDLSEMGSLQFDGLVQKEPASSAFDLVIRSQTPFSKEQQNEIAQIYTTAAQITGFRGTLAFQTTPDFPVKPLEEITTSSSGITI